MKTTVTLILAVLLSFGVGCTKTADKDFFYKKQECAKLAEAEQKKIAQKHEESMASKTSRFYRLITEEMGQLGSPKVDRVCYSETRDTCVAFIVTSYSKPETAIREDYDLKDLLTGERIDAVRQEEGESYENYQSRKKNMFNNAGCVN